MNYGVRPRRHDRTVKQKEGMTGTCPVIKRCPAVRYYKLVSFLFTPPYSQPIPFSLHIKYVLHVSLSHCPSIHPSIPPSLSLSPSLSLFLSLTLYLSLTLVMIWLARHSAVIKTDMVSVLVTGLHGRPSVSLCQCFLGESLSCLSVSVFICLCISQCVSHRACWGKAWMDGGVLLITQNIYTHKYTHTHYAYSSKNSHNLTQHCRILTHTHMKCVMTHTQTFTCHTLPNTHNMPSHIRTYI